MGSPAARRNLTIRNGAGGSTTRFQGTATIHGSISVTNGDGFDTFRAFTTTFTVTGTGSVTIRNGADGSDTLFDSGISSIGGNLTLIATDGSEAVNLVGVTVTGATLFNTGNDDDVIEADNSTFTAFKLVTGAGADLVAIEDGLNDGAGAVFNGAVNINLGGGDDLLLIGTDVDDLADFNAAVTFAGGMDLDILQENVTNSFAVPPVISGFEQV